MTLAQAGHRVALVDADLRRPRIHEVFGIPQAPGFTDLILGAEARGVVSHVDIDGGNELSVYPSGSLPSNPSELLSGRRTGALLGKMGDHYDYVIVDSAPILPVADSVALAGGVDGVLVVAQAGRASDSDVTDTIERLERVSAPILGLVLNRATTRTRGGYAYGGYRPPPRAKGQPPVPAASTNRSAPTVDTFAEGSPVLEEPEDVRASTDF